MWHHQARWRWVAAVMAMLWTVLAAGAPAMADQGNFNYLVPNLRGYQLENEGAFDVNGNGTKETYSVLYSKGEDEEAMSLAKGKNGPIYGWCKWNKNYEKSDLSHNYTIIKTTANGPFDLRIKTSDTIPVPDWVE